MPTENTIRFIPRKGLSENLGRCEIVEGQFVLSLDDRKIYVDAVVNGTLQRIPLGGDITTATILWNMISSKPFSSLNSSDFSVNEQDILSVNSNLKFLNKQTLDKITLLTSEDNENLLYNDTFPLMAQAYNTNLYESPSQSDVDDIISSVWGA